MMPSNARACVVLVALVMAPWVRAADGAVADSATLANATSTITAMDAPPTDAADNDEKQSSSRDAMMRLQRARKHRSRIRQDSAFTTWNKLEGSDELHYLHGSRGLAMVDSFMQATHGAQPTQAQTPRDGLYVGGPVEDSYSGPRISMPVTRAEAGRSYSSFAPASAARYSNKAAVTRPPPARRARQRPRG